jgi:hypothetical protein
VQAPLVARNCEPVRVALSPALPRIETRRRVFACLCVNQCDRVVAAIPEFLFLFRCICALLTLQSSLQLRKRSTKHERELATARLR